MVFLCWVVCACLSVSAWPGCQSLPLHAGHGPQLPTLDDVVVAHNPSAAHQHLSDDTLLPVDPHSINLSIGEARELLRELNSGSSGSSSSSADSSATATSAGSLMEALQQQPGLYEPVDATGADLSDASVGEYIVDPSFLALLDDIVAQKRLSKESVPAEAPSSSSSRSSNSIRASSNSNTMALSKRGWGGMRARNARSRPQGLSLSIDASMKVLREALYLEIARKKQRQHQLRAAHNHQLLQTIGKRDTQRQLRQAN